MSSSLAGGEPVFVGIERNCWRCGRDFRADGRQQICPDCRKPKARAPAPPAGKPLSFRERQIAALVAQAKANKQIAYGLHLTEGTVKGYLFHIFRKLGVGNRVELALWQAGRV